MDDAGCRRRKLFRERMLPDWALLCGDCLATRTSELYPGLGYGLRLFRESSLNLAGFFLGRSNCVWLFVESFFLLPCDQTLGLAPRNGSSDDSEAIRNCDGSW